MGINAEALAGKLREILLKKIAAGALALPPLPSTVAKVQALLPGGHVEPSDTIQVFEQDPVLALEAVRRAGALQIAQRNHVRTLAQAADYLGPNGIRQLFSDTTGRELYKSRSPDIRDRCEQLWVGSVAVADASRRIALLAGLPEPDEAYLAGLMHGVGRPVAGIMLLELERAIARHQQSTWIEVGTWLDIVEQVQAPVGTTIAKSWKLSPEISDAVGEGVEFDAGNRQSVANAVRLAHAMATCADLFYGGNIAEADTMLVIGRSILGLKNEDVTGVRDSLLQAA